MPQEALVAGLAIAENSNQTATVGVMAAGMVPYFSERYCYDLLGKSDSYIARLPARPNLSVGHNKFDILYSLEKEPDILVTFLPATVVTEWAEYNGGLLANLSNHYTVALVDNAPFQQNYLSNPVLIERLQQRNAVYIHNNSAEMSHLADWQQP